MLSGGATPLLPHPGSSKTLLLKCDPLMYWDSICAFILHFTTSKASIWRLSEAIVSLCMQIFQLVTSRLRLHPCTLLLGCRPINNSSCILYLTGMIKSSAKAFLSAVNKLETVQPWSISDVKSTIILFSWAVGDKLGRHVLRFFLFRLF